MDGLIRSKGKTTVSDAINPSHYQRHGAQLIDLIEHLPGNRFNAAKYVVRAGEKSPDTLIEDLDKGLWYQLRELYRLEVIDFNPAAPEAWERLRRFLGWCGPDKPTEEVVRLVDYREAAARTVPRMFERFADIPREVQVVTDNDGDKWWTVEGPPVNDVFGPYTEVIA